MGKLILFLHLLANAGSPDLIQKVVHGEITARLIYDERGAHIEGDSGMLHLIDYRAPEEGVFIVGDRIQAVGTRCGETAREFASWRRSWTPRSCDVTAFVPKRIAQLLGYFRYGANCFNTSLFVAGLTDKFEVTSDRDLIEALRNSCHAREDGRPQPGDLTVIWSSEHGRRAPIHTFTYVGENVAFEKPNLGIHEPYRFLQPGAILSQWNVHPALRFSPPRARERLLSQWPGGIYAEAYDCSSSAMSW